MIRQKIVGLIRNRLGFFGFVDNWHSHPVISPILCYIGRHDYEPSWVETETVVMHCFYCQKEKHSSSSEVVSSIRDLRKPIHETWEVVTIEIKVEELWMNLLW